MTRKLTDMLTVAIVVAMMLTSCYAKVVVLQEAPKEASAPVKKADSKPAAITGVELRTGLSFTTSTTKSKDGQAQSEVTLVAVAVDAAGVIQDCVIDMVQAQVAFDEKGNITSDTGAVIESKNELGPRYGMAKASAIGKEWDEQMKSLSEYVVGKSAEEVRGISFKDGKPADVDLASSVTVYMGGFINAIAEAADNAVSRGAKVGDTLELVTLNSISSSQSAAADKSGLAQADTTAAVITLNGDVITSCYIDAVQAKVSFDANGRITSALESDVRTKNELGKEYGMSKYSSLGADWDAQAAAYCEYITGKTLSEAMGIAVNEKTAPLEADLSSSVTMAIGGFQGLLAKVR